MSKNEMIDWIKMYNGKMNCYYTIYDFAEFYDFAQKNWKKVRLNF